MKTVQRSPLCRSRRELSNAYFVAKFGFDTTDNEPCKVCPLSAYRSPRYAGDVEDQRARIEQELARVESDLKTAEKRSAVIQAHGESLAQKKERLKKELAEIMEFIP